VVKGAKQLAEKFNTQKKHMMLKIAQLDTSSLEELGSKIFDFNSLEDVNKWLNMKNR